MRNHRNAGWQLPGISLFWVFCASVCCALPLPPGTVATHGTRNVVLVYLDARSEETPTNEFHLSPVDYASLLVKADNRTEVFDGILFTGYVWKNHSCFWPGQCPQPLTSSDWQDILQLWSTMGFANLHIALTQHASHLWNATHPFRVFVTIVYPDERQQNFTDWCGNGGRALNFSVFDDRIAAMECWIQSVAAAFRIPPLANNMELAGFYWFVENMDNPGDVALVQNISARLHQMNLTFLWIPDFNALQYAVQWKSFGFDAATLQPNFAFYNSTLQRFAEVNETISNASLGVEMELSLAVRNPWIQDNATTSFYDYVAAAREYHWATNAFKTYYNGNDFIVMAKTTNNATLQGMYNVLVSLCESN